jgi:hypothetical protein
MEVKVRRDELVPFVAMAIMEACTIALTIMAKTALTGGMSPFVFVVYTNAFGSILLLPFSFLFHRNERTEQSIFSWPLLVRVFFLGFTGWVHNLSLLNNVFLGSYHIDYMSRRPDSYVLILFCNNSNFVVLKPNQKMRSMFRKSIRTCINH